MIHHRKSAGSYTLISPLPTVKSRTVGVHPSVQPCGVGSFVFHRTLPVAGFTASTAVTSLGNSTSPGSMATLTGWPPGTPQLIWSASAAGMFSSAVPALMVDPLPASGGAGGRRTAHRTVPGAVQARDPVGQDRPEVPFSGDAGVAGSVEHAATARSPARATTPVASTRHNGAIFHF